MTGRVADPRLCSVHSYMRSAGCDDWDRLAAGTLAGHLLECGAQVAGGYFADPGYKDVPGLAEVGYPIAEIASDGDIVITKPSGSGGVIDRLTVIEQLLYEIYPPAAYLAPDVVLDLTDVEVSEIGKDRVRVTGACGKPAPEMLKATVCVKAASLARPRFPTPASMPRPVPHWRPRSSASAWAARPRPSDTCRCDRRSERPRQ